MVPLRQMSRMRSSEQALLVEHAMLGALRKHGDPEATVCHIAYGPTLEPPQQVQPEPNIFLEYAPIRRAHDRPFEQQTDLPVVDRIEMLDANLEVFPARPHRSWSTGSTCPATPDGNVRPSDYRGTKTC